MLKPYNRAEINFREIREIGQDGQNSSVHIVYDSQLNDEIVIKQISKAKMGNVDEYFSEARLLYSSRHSNVVQIYYACQDDDCIYIAMPYYTNGSIKDVINSRSISLREVIKYSMEFLSGLHNIHSKGMIHFDVKPDNILIDAKGSALISDFGQSKSVNCIGIAEQDRIYSRQIPPEAIDGYRFDVRFDIYQTGLTLYRMLNGNAEFTNQLMPFLDDTGSINDRDGYKFAVRNGRFPDRNVYLDHVPKKMREIVNKCLEVNPDERYSNCLDLMNDLSELDVALDWVYSKSETEKIWICDKGDKTIKFTMNGSSFNAKRIMNASHRTYSIPECTKDSPTKRDLYRFFMGY
jgi:serine/threonine protein kinase